MAEYLNDERTKVGLEHIVSIVAALPRNPYCPNPQNLGHDHVDDGFPLESEV